MGLFSKKDKYEIDGKDNIPQFVYGIPDELRKKWEKEYEEKNGTNVFAAFEGGHFGPSYYYFVNYINDAYEFRFGISENGKIIENRINEPGIMIVKHDKDFYKSFIDELLIVTCNWNEAYNNNMIMDGTQWNINFVNMNKKYYGSNAYPDNYDKAFEILNKYFNVDLIKKSDNEKYDIKPEDNVPYEVYGIPDVMQNNINGIEGGNVMNYNSVEQGVINNEFDYSNIVPTVDAVSYLVKYCEDILNQFLKLVEEDEEKNKQFKDEYKDYMYKKTYFQSLEIYIREKSYNNITCKDYNTFISAVKDGNLKNVNSLEIKLHLNFERGKGHDLDKHENKFTIIFNPYDIKFARISNHNDDNMSRIENQINSILKQFPVANSIFCSK